MSNINKAEVKAMNKIVNKANFAKDILPVIKTLNFDYKDEVNVDDETYFMFNNKYYYIKKLKYKSSSYNFIEYRCIRQEIAFNQVYQQCLSYYDNVLERCCIRFNPTDNIKKGSYTYKNDIQIEDYYIEHYKRTFIPNTKCMFCNTKHRHKHNTNSKKHKTNYENFIIELSKTSSLNSDCIKKIMAFLF